VYFYWSALADFWTGGESLEDSDEVTRWSKREELSRRKETVKKIKSEFSGKKGKGGQ
jgi:hypothetical protein